MVKLVNVDCCYLYYLTLLPWRTVLYCSLYTAGDSGLVLKSKAKHAAIAAKLRKPFKFNTETMLVVQYEIAFQVHT